MSIDMKETIAETAKYLVSKKQVRKLTVKDIVDECQITRQTFYYHFEDIPGLFRWILEQDAEHLLHKVSSMVFTAFHPVYCQLLSHFTRN